MRDHHHLSSFHTFHPCPYWPGIVCIVDKTHFGEKSSESNFRYQNFAIVQSFTHYPSHVFAFEIFSVQTSARDPVIISPVLFALVSTSDGCPIRCFFAFTLSSFITCRRRTCKSAAFWIWD